MPYIKPITRNDDILLIQGPSGIGKTHTILVFISMLLKNGNNLKILVCEQSNAAFDGICASLSVQGIYDINLKKVKCCF